MIHGTCVEKNLQEAVLSTMWTFRIEIKSSGLVAKTITHWAILLDLNYFYFIYLFIFATLEIGPKALYMLDKGCTYE